MKRVSDSLAWLGGADLVVLEQAPSQQAVFIQMGIVLLTTAGLAGMSMFFAVNSGLQENWAVSAVIAIFWGAIILNLDRLMLLSMGRTRNRKHLLIAAVPWLSLAAVQSFVTSTPFVLRIFSSTINAQLEAMHAGDGSILAQLQALSDLSKGGTLPRLSFILVFLLFFLIEILPFFVRLLLNLGPMTVYDRVAAASEEQMMQLHDLASAAAAQEAQSKLAEFPSKDQVAFIQELAHSLNTPLSQIEAAALLLSDDLQKDSVAASGPRTPARRIHHSVEICKAFLAAFMQITKVASQTSKWNPESLQASLHAAAELYADRAQSGVKSSIHIGVEPRGYPASYIMAVTLPVIENAFESAKPGSMVSVEITTEPREYRIQITSAYEKIPDVDSMYMNGFTTKAGHQGVGLSVVQRLLSAYQGAHITHEIIEGRIGFVISLPRR
jgi:signal transduction histidine kinase